MPIELQLILVFTASLCEMQQCVIDYEAVALPVAVRNFHGSKTFGNGAQSQPFRSSLFLAFDVSCANDQRQPLQPGCAELIVFNDRFKSAALAAMVQLDLRQTRCVEENGAAFLCFQQLLFGHKKKFRVMIDKLLNQPRTSYPVNFYVPACDPFHISPLYTV